MNFLLKSALKSIAFAGICVYCNHKRKNICKTAYRQTGKLMQTARRKHRFLDGSAEYKRQRYIEQKKVNRVEKVKKLFKIF